MPVSRVQGGGGHGRCGPLRQKERGPFRGTALEEVSENELEPCLVTDIDLLKPLLRVADPEVMFGEEADMVFPLGHHVVEADASEQVVVLSQSEGGGEKITDIESGQGGGGPDGRRFEFVVQLEPFADRDVDPVSRFRRYFVAVGLVVVADAQDTVGIFAAGSERYDRISQHVVSQGDAFFTLFDDVDEADGEVALFRHIDQYGELDALHLFGYIHQSGELKTFDIFCDVEQPGELYSGELSGRVEQSGKLDAVEIVGDVAHSRELKSGEVVFGTVVQSADQDAPAVRPGTVHHSGELHTHVAFPRDVRHSRQSHSSAFTADVGGDTGYL